MHYMPSFFFLSLLHPRSLIGEGVDPPREVFGITDPSPGRSPGFMWGRSGAPPHAPGPPRRGRGKGLGFF
jgi:hypothetical protein